MAQTGEYWHDTPGTEERTPAHADRLAGIIRSRTDTRFTIIGDPLEAAMLAVFIKLMKVMRSDERGLQTGRKDPAARDAAKDDDQKRKNLMR